MKDELDILATGLERHLKAIKEQAECAFDVAARDCESPIEKLMLAALAFLPASVWGDTLCGSIIDNQASLPLEIIPQFQIGAYRVDFAIRLSDPRDEARSDLQAFKIVVECDGHDFHEKTKEQAQRDKARDRALSRMGWTVLRFTGSEIYRDPFACAAQVQAHIEAARTRYFARDVA